MMKEVIADAEDDGPVVVKEWNVDDFHEYLTSLEDVFKKTFNSTPIFTIIDCDQYKRKFPLLSKHRHREDLVHFLNCIESFGGKYTFLPEKKTNKAIPLAFMSLDDQQTQDVVASWKQNEELQGRLPRDVFSERYIMEILRTGTIPDLKDFLIGESHFLPYSANLILKGRLGWDSLREPNELSNTSE